MDDARAEGAQFVIAMAHLGNESECKPYTYADVIANTTGIDAFLDVISNFKILEMSRSGVTAIEK